MLQDQTPSHAGDAADDTTTEVRDIHALIPSPHPSSSRGRRQEPWEVSSHLSSTPSVGSEIENFTTMSTEFNAMVVAGNTQHSDGGSNDSLARIREELEETNPLAIVPDNNPIPSPRRGPVAGYYEEDVSVPTVKKAEVETKISAWQTAEIAKINNRFKREDVVINGWENEQVEKATAWLKRVERKLDEKRARAIEKMQNDAAKARRKAEEKRASAEAKRGTKVASVLDLAHLMRAMGKAPSKRSFF